MEDLTPVQFRVLRYCAFDGRWISLRELNDALQTDDVVAVPSLIQRGLLEHEFRLRTVRITEKGRGAAASHD